MSFNTGKSTEATTTSSTLGLLYIVVGLLMAG
jgi:hypothetical protein